MTVANRTVGDVEASEEAGDDTVVWASTTSYRDQIGNIRSRSAERYAFDAHTGEAINCCGSFEETTDGEREEVKRSGQISKYPFGTEQQDYKFWDATLGQAVTTKFVKEDEIDGLKVYEFKYEVPTTTVGTREIPPSLDRPGGHRGARGRDPVLDDHPALGRADHRRGHRPGLRDRQHPRLRGRDRDHHVGWHVPVHRRPGPGERRRVRGQGVLAPGGAHHRAARGRRARRCSSSSAASCCPAATATRSRQRPRRPTTPETQQLEHAPGPWPGACCVQRPIGSAARPALVKTTSWSTNRGSRPWPDSGCP